MRAPVSRLPLRDLKRRDSIARARADIDALRDEAGPFDGYADAVLAVPLKKVSKSALIWSALVAGMPCGKPL